MKKSKLSVLAVAAVGACCCFTAVACGSKSDDTHTHEYGEWEITQYPTDSVGGKISRMCVDNDGGIETIDVPNLADSAFWTVQTTPAGHGTTGQSVFSNAEYGVEFKVTIPAQDHTWGAWVFVDGQKPTTEVGGKITCTCTADDGGVDTKDVPALTDSTFWTAGTLDAPGHTTSGSQTFTNATYNLSVTVTLDATGHTWGKWAFADGQAATEDNGGKIVRECSAEDEGVEELAVPALSDATFWNKATITADYNTAGYDVYTPKDTKIAFEARVKTAEKLVAPYDNKTYYALAYQLASSANLDKAISIGSSWNQAALAFGGENGNVGVATAYPYRNMLTTIEMVDAAIGKVKITMIEFENGTEADPVILPDAVAKEYVGYVNMDEDDGAYGLIIYQNENRDYFVLTPFTYTETSNIYDDDGEEIIDTKTNTYGYHAGTVSSSWTFIDDNGFSCKGLAVSYKYGEEASKVVNFYLEEDAVTNFRVYFGAKFENKKDNSGTAIAADKVFNSKAVYIKTADGQNISAFGYNGTFTNKLDGFEGAYTGTLDGVTGAVTLNVDGIGGFTGKNGSRYEVAAKGSSYTLDAYIDGAYYELTLDSDGSFTSVKPMVKVTFNRGESGKQEVEYNKNIEIPIADDTGAGFMGWFFDATFNNRVPAKFTPTKDVELFARFSTTYIEFYVDDEVGALKVYYVDGAKLGDLVPDSVETNDTAKKRYLVGWFTQADGKGTQVGNNAALYAEDSGVTVYAYWATTPDYSGTYYGTEIWAQTNGNSSSKTVTINELDAMTGAKSGTIKSYDPTTQLVEWVSGSSTYAAYYDADSGIFVLNDSNKAYMTSDLYVMSRYYTSINYKLNAAYGIETAPVGTETSRGYYAHIVNMKINANDDGDVLFYNGHIYVDVTITNTKGETLAVGDIQNSKDVIIKDKLGDTVLAVASKGANFKTNSSTIDLDEYYGTYTNGADSITLDGSGGISGSQIVLPIAPPTETPNSSTTITYTAVAEYTAKGGGVFDVYTYVLKTTKVVGSGWGSSTTTTNERINYEYFKLTLSGKTYTLVKEMKTLTDGTLGGTYSFNINVATELPTPTNADTTKIFRGWYTDALCRVPVTLDNGKYTFTDDETLYSKWENKVTVTVHYNAATAPGAPEDKDFLFASGELAEIKKPSSTMKFVGWFTDPTFSAESAWTPGEQIYADVDIYAKWAPAPAYYKTYTSVIEINGTTANGGASAYNAWSSPKFSIDADGLGTLINSSYPINNSNISITGYDDADGTFIFNMGTNKYRGWVDKATGILIINKATGESTDIGQVWFFAPFDGVATQSNYKSSYWNGGKTRVIQFTSNGTTYSYFIENNVIYSGATFKTAATGGEDIAGNACHNATDLYVTATGYTTKHFGFNGTTMMEDDGYADTYTDSGSYGSVVVNGVGSITINGKTGYYAAIVDNKLTTTIDGVFYEVTLNKTGKTCTVVAPTGTATFVFDNATAVLGESTVTSNVGVALSINVAFDMPTVTAVTGYQFVGWYEDAAYTKAITAYTFTTTGAAKTFYAKVQEAPAWSSKATAEAKTFDGSGLITVNGATDDLNRNYWFKFEVAQAGAYYLYSPSASKVGGTQSNANYARYSLIKDDGAENGTVIVGGLSFATSATNVHRYSLEAGTYYIHVNLGGKVEGSTYDYDCYGTFTVNVVNQPDIAYTLGETVSVTKPTILDGYIYKYYYVDLEEGTYTLSAPTKATGGQIRLVTINSSGKETTVYSAGYWDESVSKEFTVTTAERYYVVCQVSCEFKIEVKAS